MNQDDSYYLIEAYQRLWDEIYHFNNIVRNLDEKDPVLAKFGKDYEDLHNSLCDYLTHSKSMTNKFYRFKR